MIFHPLISLIKSHCQLRVHKKSIKNRANCNHVMACGLWARKNPVWLIVICFMKARSVPCAANARTAGTPKFTRYQSLKFFSIKSGSIVKRANDAVID
ncbi:hypothetical protein [Burkholderia sp. Bp8963]|uniref:hypothetical protein n=1 Tax=Burkholderia sp. Bp8963 TaxID=2184547 RepID=UPI000F5ADC87|nr:hypothetical protein [Burkholderia sp. Bp8963]